MYRRIRPEVPSLVFALALVLVAHPAASRSAGSPGPRLVTPDVRRAMQEASPRTLKTHVRFLADDLLQGRDTGSPGGWIAARYIASQLELLGIPPAGDNGTYYQSVALARTRIDPAGTHLRLTGGGTEELRFGDEFLPTTRRRQALSLETPMVFLGYGIAAPEFKYDDYAGQDVKGKLVVVLTGEPVSTDPAFFEGAKDSKYADSTAKAVVAREKGATGMVTLNFGARATPGSWNGLRSFTSGSRTELVDVETPVFPQLVVRDEAAPKLFAGADRTWEQVKEDAAAGRVKPMPLPRRADIAVAVEKSPVPAANVVAKLEGSDPVLKQQVVVLSAHYDHVGTRPGEGDTIYNGAWDNASGTAGVLAAARAFTALKTAPKRSVLFLFLTAEERGLLGSRYYTRHPAVPLAQTAANINMDMLDIFGQPLDFVPLGAEHSTLASSAERVARELNLKVAGDPIPNERIWTRSDHYSFVRAGVPSIFLCISNDYQGMTPEESKRVLREALNRLLHKVADEFDPNWSWEGMATHAQVGFLLTLDSANRPEMHQWKPGDELDKPRRAPEE
jgi:hypothetical protein